MRVNLANQINFGRALTTKEKSDYKKLIEDCKKELGIKDTTAIAFDFNIPAEDGKNTAIGSTWSGSMQQFVPFLKDMTGITSIQLQPQGKISTGNTSPYSGTNFSYGEHIIALDKLTQKEYGSLLLEEYIKQLDDDYPKDKTIREYKTDYGYVLGENGVQEKALRKAFETFQDGIENKKSEILKLNKEFEKFKKENEEWLKVESEFALFVKHYGTDDFSQWEFEDRTLYGNGNYWKEIGYHDKRIDELKAMYGDDFEYEAFVQFLADKQQKESKKYLNSQAIKLYGDCLIGFSQSEMWGNLQAFKEGQYYGGPDPNCTETNGVQTWNLPAINYNKLTTDRNDQLRHLTYAVTPLHLLPKKIPNELGSAGKLLLEKYKKFFERYDGVRVDAAWQFITPFIYENKDGKIKQVEIKNEDKDVFFEILDRAQEEVSKKKDKNIMLELVGLSADESRKATLNKYPHLYTTAYAEYDENPTAFIKKGYQPDMFYVGVGCHDNDSLINQSKDEYKRKIHMADLKKHFPALNGALIGSLNVDKDFRVKDFKNMSESNYRTVKLAELFTVPKQFFTLPDMFGMSERINISGKCSDDNWTVRLPKDFERFYFSQLSKGFGLNMPKVLRTAMLMKELNNKKAEELIKKCDEASSILIKDGPMTEQEANLAKETGLLKETFSY